MAAYIWRPKEEPDFQAEVFRVDKPRGRWLIAGEHKAVPGFLCIRYVDKLPEGCRPMNKEAAPHRQMAIEEQLEGAPLPWQR